MRAASGSELWLLRLMAERGLRLLGASGLLIAMSRGSQLELIAEAGLAEPRVRSLPLDGSALGELCRSRAEVCRERPSPRDSPWLTELGLVAGAVLVEPLPVDEQPGLLIALRRTEPGFDRGDVAAASDLARSIVERLEAERSIERERLRHGVLARERERSRWARELHDETIQGLGSLRLLLEYAHCLTDQAEREKALQNALVEVDREIESLRHLITELRPAALDDLGLVAALEALARRAGAIDGLTIETDIARVETVPRLAPEVESAVYRITQEALTNTAKHSGAAHAVLALQLEGDRLVAAVSDDGSGFSVARDNGRPAPRRGEESRMNGGLPPGLSGGVGLSAMRERAELVGAELDIRSNPGEGTTVRVSVPLSARPTAEQ
jgi:signal transduction histidine kinase